MCSFPLKVQETAVRILHLDLSGKLHMTDEQIDIFQLIKESLVPCIKVPPKQNKIIINTI